MLKSKLQDIRSFHTLFVCCFFVCFLLRGQSASAQQFGGTPPSVKWQQVNTPTVRLIFPPGMDSTALDLARIINSMAPNISGTIGNRQRQVSIVLQNFTTESNGYVGLAPFRSEFYLTPDQNSFELGSIPWPRMLAIHEYRHVQQYTNFNVGLSRALSFLFGEGGQALGNALSVPNWFFEGDAVYNETLVSGQGRGRLPYFFKDYRALWAAGKQYSWMKLRNGSYVDMVPNHYPLGYMLVAYGRERYGDTFWKDVTHDAAAFKYGFYPLQKAVKAHAHISFEQFRADALNFFQKQFKDSTKLSAKHFVADHEFPAYVNDSTIIYLKSAYNHLPKFVMKTGDHERIIATRGLSQDRYFDYCNGKIVYAGYRPDVRWGNLNYHEIRILDIQTGHEHAITSKTKYFSPAFDAAGNRLVAVDVQPNGKSALHVLDASNGTIIKALPNPKNLFFTYPKFLNDSEVVAAVRNKLGQMAIVQLSLTDGKEKLLLPFSYSPVGYLTVDGDRLYFTSTSGVDDQLFMLSLSDGNLKKLQQAAQSHAIGNYQPAASVNKLAWVGYTANGFVVTQKGRNDLKWTDFTKENSAHALEDFNVESLNQNSAANILNRVNDTIYRYDVKNYSKSHNLFNFHSLIPEISDPDYRVSISGENVLNTFQSELFFNYNRDEGYKQAGFNAVYGALFPYITGGVDYIFDRRRFYSGQHIYWNELNLHGGLRVPLNFSRGRNITGLTVGSDIYFTNANYSGAYNRFDRRFTYSNSTLQFTNRIQQARQHIYPHWGQSFTFIYKSAISVKANQFLAAGTLFLPGIGSNHSLLISAAHQEHGMNDAVSFSNNFPFSIGYTAENLYRLNKIVANYHFPIAYPDAGLANTVYLMRIRGNLFYDHTEASHFYVDGSKFKGTFRSVGATLYLDTKFFNEQPLTFGLRYSHLLDRDLFGGAGQNRFEIVMPVSIF